ncbi:hypothetical protein OEZ85_011031 [Tetradesmus obliquus]|uniref:Uncharacterized protein n=1 Tax=Tetradesmus obliquus TaxID=3088 RepID=A0ABY8TPG4_TETOB|nr:hypothetical protein OEZ85_011031 [Tetradesmus obliquus]
MLLSPNNMLIRQVSHPATLIHPAQVATFQQDVQSALVRRRAREALAGQLAQALGRQPEAVEQVAAGQGGEAVLREAVRLAYGCTLMYLATKAEAYAQKAVQEANWCIVQYQQILKSYVKDSGFTGESLRDSDRCCFGLAGLVHIAELLQGQGIDAYSFKLFRALELHAALLSCKRVPLGYTVDQFTILNWLQPSAWEIALDHYERRCGIAMPNVRMLLSQKLRPCGFNMHFGFDTITHAHVT